MKLNFNVDNKIEFINYVLKKILSAADGLGCDEYWVAVEAANNFLHEMKIETLSNAEIVHILVNHEDGYYFTEGFEEFFKNDKLDIDIYDWLPDTLDEKELLAAIEKYLVAETEDEFCKEPEVENATKMNIMNFQDLFNDIFKKS